MTKEDRRKAYIETLPQSTQGIVQRAFAGKSKAVALKAMCLTCCNFDRAEIAACTSVLCPLHDYRPFRPAEERGPKRVVVRKRAAAPQE